MKIKLYALVFLILASACKSVSVNQLRQRTTVDPVELGVVGLHEDKYPFDRFSVTAIPGLDREIRVRAVRNTFNKAKYNAYLKASPENRMQLQYIDSLPQKPQYISLQLIDRVRHSEALNADKELLEYLRTRTDLFMVTSVAAAVTSPVLDMISRAESVFLVYDKSMKKYYMEIRDRNSAAVTVNMQDMEVFAYGLSFFCWAENDRHEVVVRDIVEEHNTCSPETRRKASKVKKELNYFKL